MRSLKADLLKMETDVHSDLEVNREIDNLILRLNNFKGSKLDLESRYQSRILLQR